ncbi:unnamed protein product [Prunus brigantina]
MGNQLGPSNMAEGTTQIRRQMEGNQDPFDIENQHIPLATCMRDDVE